MKRFAISVLVLILCLGLFACGGKPEGLSDEQYEEALKVVETADKYLDGTLTRDEAEEEVKYSSSGFDVAEMGSDESLASSVKTDILMVIGDIMHSSDETLKESRNELARAINY